MTKSTGVGRGGKRAGAGMKALDGAKPVGGVSVWLDQESVDMLEGFPNNSVALRALLAELRSYRAGPRVLKSSSKLPPKPVRREVPTHSPDGVKYGITKQIQLNAEADREFAAATTEWNLKNSGTVSS